MFLGMAFKLLLSTSMKRLILLGALALFFAACSPLTDAQQTVINHSIQCMWGGQCGN
jgi:hypothetical protein